MGDGSNIRFWLDKWLPSGESLEAWIPADTMEEEKEALVKDFTLPDGRRDVELLSNILPGYLCNQVMGIRYQKFGRE